MIGHKIANVLLPVVRGLGTVVVVVGADVVLVEPVPVTKGGRDAGKKYVIVAEALEQAAASLGLLFDGAQQWPPCRCP